MREIFFKSYRINLDRSTVSRILKNRASTLQSFQKSFNKNTQRQRPCQYPLLEEALYKSLKSDDILNSFSYQEACNRSKDLIQF